MLTKKKPKIQASDVGVGNRTLEGVLMDLAERMALIDERSARAEERSARAEEEIAALRRDNGAMLQHLSSLTRDHMGLAGQTQQIVARVEALEKAS